jgi:hypothetical protein
MPQSGIQISPIPSPREACFTSPSQRCAGPCPLDLYLIGTILREAREAKGTSLSDAAEALFVKKSTVGAIESGRWEMLPHPFYVKGYVRSYASYLGIAKTIETFLQRSTVGRENEKKTMPTAHPASRHPTLFPLTATARIARVLWGVIDICILTVSGMRRAVLPRF